MSEAIRIDTADCAKLLRKDLTEHFPGQKFSVKISRYSMGSSIRVRWTDGPMTAEVDPIAQRFAGASFDGMDDSMHYHTSDLNGQRVRFGADFVFCIRDTTKEG